MVSARTFGVSSLAAALLGFSAAHTFRRAQLQLVRPSLETRRHRRHGRLPVAPLRANTRVASPQLCALGAFVCLAAGTLMLRMYFLLLALDVRRQPSTHSLLHTLLGVTSAVLAVQALAVRAALALLCHGRSGQRLEQRGIVNSATSELAHIDLALGPSQRALPMPPELQGHGEPRAHPQHSSRPRGPAELDLERESVLKVR